MYDDDVGVCVKELEFERAPMHGASADAGGRAVQPRVMNVRCEVRSVGCSDTFLTTVAVLHTYTHVHTHLSAGREIRGCIHAETCVLVRFRA